MLSKYVSVSCTMSYSVSCTMLCSFVMECVVQCIVCRAQINIRLFGKIFEYSTATLDVSQETHVINVHNM